MADADAESDAESAPPPPNGQAVPVAPVARGPPQHPLWQRAAGQGSPANRAKNKAGTTTVNGRFAPISMAALELRARNEFDGASTVASEQGGGGSDGRRGNGRKRSRPEPAAEDEKNINDNEDDVDVTEYDDDVNINDEDDDNGSEAASGADVLASAAFGGAGFQAGGGDQRRGVGALPRAARCGDCTTLSMMSDTDDGVSVTSSAQRNAHRRAFPVSGVDCVGCALPAKVTPVDDFVRASCDKMQEAALFKMAALIYQEKVAAPALAEGVPVPSWPWKDIRAHYTMHRMDPRMQRFENMRTLAAMRKTLELTLLREDESSGEHVLDKGNAEQIMKIINLQSKEITLLHEAYNQTGKNASKQAPPGAATKKRD